MPSKGWLNDPCAPGYDACHGIYHLGFQWNPNSTDWGEISWGAATSKDLVHWDVSEKPSMVPTDTHDVGGVFTGCMWPVAPGEPSSDTITAVYTSARILPIHYTLPHDPGAELVCTATSTDSGRTWNRDPENCSVLDGPPPGVDVTGWRDPYIASWPAVDALLGTEGTNARYGILSGGIRDVSPTTFLYRIPNGPRGQWEYVGSFICVGLNFSPSPRWMPDFGVNWEVTNFLTLKDAASGASADVLICGVEGRKTTPAEITSKGEFRATHGQMWLCGKLKRGETESAAGHRASVEMDYKYGGVLDHGALYAANSFWDPVTREHVMFGWVVEEGLPSELRQKQGFAGTLSLPRRIRLAVLQHVTHALATPLRDIGTLGVVPSDANAELFTVTTLSVTPDPRLESLRVNACAQPTSALVPSPAGLWTLPLGTPCSQFELAVSFGASHSSGRMGFTVCHTQGT